MYPSAPLRRSPARPPGTGAMPPPDMTNVPAQHYSCFPPTLLMFPLNITHVYPRHDSCFRPALSAPPGRPCGVHRNFRAPSAGALPLHCDGAWKVLSRRPCGGGACGREEGRFLWRSPIPKPSVLKSISGTRPACCGTCLALQCIRAFSSNRSPLSVFWGASALNAARSLIERGRRPCFLSGASVLRTVTIRKAKK